MANKRISNIDNELTAYDETYYVAVDKAGESTKKMKLSCITPFFIEQCISSIQYTAAQQHSNIRYMAPQDCVVYVSFIDSNKNEKMPGQEGQYNLHYVDIYKRIPDQRIARFYLPHGTTTIGLQTHGPYFVKTGYTIQYVNANNNGSKYYDMRLDAYSYTTH